VKVILGLDAGTTNVKANLVDQEANVLARSSIPLSIVLGVFPEELKENDRIRFRRKNLGFAFQQFNLLPALTAAENVAVSLLAAGKGQAGVSWTCSSLTTLVVPLPVRTGKRQ
jgi:ABC-type lipoprotein export system ATPase subunit